MGRIYQNEKVLMREVGLLKTVELNVVSNEIRHFEGTKKQIDAECERIMKNEDVVYVAVFERK